ncbi:MAG: BrnT family toxin [Burkholderiales bacterium]
MAKARFDWDPRKDRANRKKHGVAFSMAQIAFADTRRVIAEDQTHSTSEQRYFCFGWVDGGVLTVRFTYRDKVIRIIGAGYWRKGKQIYERENQVHGRTTREPKGRS